MRHPITFLITVIIVAAAAAVFVLLTPEARIWLEQFPIEVIAVTGAAASAIVLLLTKALDAAHRSRRGRDDWAAARDGEARALAAALRGEMIALGQWLATRVTRHENSPRIDPLRSNSETENLAMPSLAARIVYETNTARLSLLGADLATAIAYCHTRFERAESELTDMETGEEAALLREIDAKFSVTIGYLDSFVADGTVKIGDSDRAALYALPDGEH